MEKILLLELIQILLFHCLEILVISLNSLFLLESLVSHIGNGYFQLGDSSVLNIIVRVFHVQGVDQLTELLFFSLDVDVVGLEVFVLLLS